MEPYDGEKILLKKQSTKLKEDVIKNTDQMSNTTPTGQVETILGLVKPLEKISSSENTTLYKVSLFSDANRIYACKKFKIIFNQATLNNNNNNNLQRERYEAVFYNLKIIQKLIHPHIIRHHKIVKSSQEFYVLMDYYPKGSIQDFLDKLNSPLEQRQAKVWFAQILGAICYIHTKGMAHRNLKLTSFLIASDHMVIVSGFINNCLAFRRETEIMRSTVIGDLIYQAPEMNALCSQVWPYNAKCTDMYALGVCLFRMVNYDLPFDPKLYETNRLQYVLKQRKKKFSYNPTYEPNIDPNIKLLISQLLEPTPGIRITANSALLHKALAPG